MANATILHHATILKSKSEEAIKKEVALNLLEDLLTLYIRVRSISFVNENNKQTLKQQIHAVLEWNISLGHAE